MFLSWWYGSENQKRNPIRTEKNLRRKRRAAIKMDQLEDRLVPANTAALTLESSLTAAAVRTQVVPVFIDVGTMTDTSGTPGVASGTFWVKFDPNVLTASDASVKVGPLLSGVAGNTYTLLGASGENPAGGLLGIGLSGGAGALYSGTAGGRIIEIDFTVNQAAFVGSNNMGLLGGTGISTLLDLTNSTGTTNKIVLQDTGGNLYTVSPATTSYVAQSAKQKLAFSGFTAGNTFTLSAGGQTTGAITYNATAATLVANLQAALDPIYGAGNTLVSGTAVTNLAVTFQGAMANSNQSLIAKASGTGTLTVTNTAVGFSGVQSALGQLTATQIEAPGNNGFDPSDVAISVMAQGAVAAPTPVNDTYTMSPNSVAFTGAPSTYTGMLSTTAANSVVSNDTLASGAPIGDAVNAVMVSSTTHGTLTLNGDGTFNYTPAVDFVGVDSFTYKAVDATSNAQSSGVGTVTINVGEVISIPSALTKTGNTVSVPVNIANPNPAGSGGLVETTIALNYDATKFTISTAAFPNPDIAFGSVIPGGWTAVENTLTPGQIVVVLSGNSITTTAPGSLLVFTLHVQAGATGTSVVNLAGTSPAPSETTFATMTGSPASMPLVTAPVDNTNFNGSAGPLDGLATLSVVTTTATTTAVTTTTPSAVYGNAVTYSIAVSANTGTTPPSQGSVEVFSGTTDLGAASFVNNTGATANWTFTTGVKAFKVGAGIDIHAVYTAGASFTGSTGTLTGGQTITARPITVTATTNTKGYDGNTSAAAAPTVTGGTIVTGDTATAFTETYDTKNAGSGKTLTASGSVLDGNGGANYAITFKTDTTGAITARSITVTAASNTKGYDGNTSAAAIPTVTGGTLVAGEIGTFAESYDTKNAGSGKTLTAIGLVSDGNGGNNYAITFKTDTTGAITARAITVTAASNTKGYDGNTSAAGTPTVTGGTLVSGETGTFTETYDTKNAGSGKTLTATGAVGDGNGGNNYAITFKTDTTGSISQRAITVTATTNTKGFDGNTSASAIPTVTGGTLVSGETGAFTETYDTATAGTGKTLTPAGTVNDGNSGNNYSYSFKTDATGSIVTGIVSTTTAVTSSAGASVVYGNAVTFTATVTASSGASAPSQGSVSFSIDGGTAVAGTFGTSSGLTSTWTITTSASQLKVNGSPHSVTAVYTAGSGFSGSNGSLTGGQTVTARPITVTAASNTKGYDGNTSAAATPTVTGGSLVAGDTGVFTETYDTKNAGSGKTLTAVGSVNDGSNGSNYAVTFATTTGAITARAITVTAATNTKGYDGNTSAAATPTVTGGSLVSGETGTFTETYDTKNAGSGKTLTATGAVADGNGGNNYAIVFQTATGAITARAITVSATTNTKGYDGNTSAAATPTVTGGSLVSGETGTFTETYDTKNAGSGKTLTATGAVADGNGGNNYAIVFQTATGAITARAITVSATTNTKGYDGNTSAAATPTVTGGSLVSGETGTFTETYDTKNAGSGKTLTATGAVADGNGGNNYAIVFQTATGAITARAITVSATTNTKGYDGNTSAAATPTVTGGSLVSGETGTFTETYDTKNAGSGKTLTATGAVADGNGGNNYAIVFQTATGAITARAITVSATTNTKGYDGNTSAAATPTVTGGSLVSGETGTFTETYDTKNAGSGKTLTATGAVADGNGGNNYAIVFQTATGAITARAITVSATTNTKGYDGNTSAAATPTVTGGSLVSGETGTFTETYDTKNAGSGKTLTATGAVADGNGGNNYAIVFQTATGAITARAITVSAATNTKGYDGNTSAAATPTVTGGSLVSGETGTFTETYDTKNAGSGKTLTASGAVTDGNGGNNYAITFATATGAITARAITVTAATNTKNFDGNTSAAATPTVTGGSLVSGETGVFTETYDTSVVGTGKTLTPAGTVTDGNSGNNYSYTFKTDATGAIVANAATPTTTAITTTTPSVAYGTAVTFSITVTANTGTTPPGQGTVEVFSGTTDLGAATFANNAGAVANWTFTTGVKAFNVGAGQDVHAVYSGVTSTFTGSTGSLTGGETVTARAITVTATTNTKGYDGNTSAAATPTVTGGSLVTGDTGTFTETYDTKNAGSGKTLTATGAVTDGNGGNNYAITFATATGAITARAITVTAATNTKGYDGNTSAAATPTVTGGSLVSGETGTFTETYDTKNAGSGKTLTATGAVADGNGGNNYAITFTTATGAITARAITVSATTNTKGYDGNNSAAATPTVTGGSLVSGETGTFTETYDTKNAGSGKTLTATGAVADGNGGNNYAIVFQTATGAITARAITVAAATNTKGYDGNTSAAATPTVTGGSLVSGETGTFTETYDTKNAGSGKTLAATGAVADGNGGNNYAITFTTATGAITARAITVAAATNTKTYDHTTSASALPTVTGGSLVTGDTGSFTETYDNWNAGSGKTLTATGSVNDSNGGNNYSITFATDTTGKINTRTLQVTAATNTKGYDGNTTAAATPTITSGSLAGTDTATFTESYGSKNAGTGLQLTPAGAVSDGNGGNNYTVNFVNNATGAITKQAITVTALTNTKGYDGSASAAATPAVTGAIISGDTATFTEAYGSKNVGTGLTLTPNAAIADGNGGNNYAVTFVKDVTGAITARAITVTATTATKVYDGTTASTTAPTVTSGSLASGDSATFTETFDTKNVGTGKTLTATGAVSDGNGGNNYSVTINNDVTGAITVRAVTVTAATAVKSFDGNTSTTAVPTVTGGSIVAGDSGTFTETFDTPAIGTGKTLTPTGTISDGNGGNNYSITFSNNTTGQITNANVIHISVAAVSTQIVRPTGAGTTVYAKFVITADQIIPGFSYSLFYNTVGITATDGSDYSGLSGTIGSPGLSTTISVPIKTPTSNPQPDETFSFVLTGTSDAKAQITTSTATVTLLNNNNPTSLTVGTSNPNVPYGTPVTFTATVTGNNKPTGSVEFFDKTTGQDLGAGTAGLSIGNTQTWSLTTLPKTLKVTGGAQNIEADYLPTGGFSSSTGTLGGGETVTPLALTVTAVTNTKVYDATTSAAAVPNITTGALLAGDSATFTEVYSSKNVGSGLTLSGAGSVSDGNGGHNYSVTFLNNTTGLISARPATVTAVTNTKGFDGSTSAAGVPTITNLAAGDTGVVSEVYSDSTVGTGKTLIPSGTINDGNGGANYSLSFVNNFTGVIGSSTTAITGTGPSMKTGSGTAGSYPFQFTVKLNVTPAANYTFDYALSDGTAHAGVDFVGLTAGSLPIVKDTTTYTVTVFVYPWDKNTTAGHATLPSETFNLVLTPRASDGGATIFGPSTATIIGTILNPHLQIAAPDARPSSAVATPISAVPANILAAAEANWVATGINPAAFKQVHITTTKLPQGVLGVTSGSNIYISSDAAGFGWFVDSTPGDNSEFEKTPFVGELHAIKGSAAAGKMDLLEVLEHELGHVLGKDDTAAPHTLMTAALELGTRFLPKGQSIDLAGVFANNNDLAPVGQKPATPTLGKKNNK